MKFKLDDYRKDTMGASSDLRIKIYETINHYIVMPAYLHVYLPIYYYAYLSIKEAIFLIHHPKERKPLTVKESIRLAFNPEKRAELQEQRRVKRFMDVIHISCDT